MMTSEMVGNISQYLGQLHGHAYFRPEAGPLRESLAKAVLEGETLPREAAAALSGRAFELEVSIGRPEGDSEVALDFSVDHPGVTYRSELALAALAEDALQDLAGYLARLLQQATSSETVVAGEQTAAVDHPSHSHEQMAASARLKVSPQWLKSVIPCTDYTYEEIDGKKYIREYYWSKELIERLFKIKCTKTTPEDLQYVAEECCEGDVEWARDLIARLKSPNRAERAPKEQPNQPQKAQVKSGAPAAPGERTRSRSRHKKPFRQGGKDQSRKPEPSAGSKPTPG